MTQDGEMFVSDLFETYFTNLSYEDQMKLWNDFCNHTSGYQECVVYENGEDFLNTEFDSAYDAVQHALDGDYRTTDNYVIKDDWYDLKSSDSVEDLVEYEDNDKLLDYAIANSDFAEQYQNDCVDEFIDGLRENDKLNDVTDDKLRELLKGYDLIVETDWDTIEEEILEELGK